MIEAVKNHKGNLLYHECLDTRKDLYGLIRLYEERLMWGEDYEEDPMTVHYRASRLWALHKFLYQKGEEFAKFWDEEKRPIHHGRSARFFRNS